MSNNLSVTLSCVQQIPSGKQDGSSAGNTVLKNSIPSTTQAKIKRTLRTFVRNFVFIVFKFYSTYKNLNIAKSVIFFNLKNFCHPEADFWQLGIFPLVHFCNAKISLVSNSFAGRARSSALQTRLRTCQNPQKRRIKNYPPFQIFQTNYYFFCSYLFLNLSTRPSVSIIF